MCMYVCLYEFLCTTCMQESREARRRGQIPYNWGYREVLMDAES